MANKKKLRISITITVKTETERKTYDITQDFEGDPKKLDISVIINGWFLENNINMSDLDSLHVSVWSNSDVEMLNW